MQRVVPALTIKNTKGEIKEFLTVSDNLIINNFIIDKVKNHTGLELLEKGEKYNS